jgi:serine/threonine protein kinase
MQSPGGWMRVQQLFHQASEIEESSRAAFLSEACAGDEELRREVESLLKASDETGGFFENAVQKSAASLLGRLPAAGDRLGPYELKRPLGQGGMGSVFLAVRADGAFEKEVAIKLVRTGFDTPAARDRFRTERQILAALDHPDIARLLDGGEGPNGEPFVVMEYVEGVPLDEYCRQRKLSVEERIDLFRRICTVVAYAHRRLVVHRDIKPANILVTADGTPKLVDFGIAKLLDATDSVPALTRVGERAMTLESASPEQILGKPITTASDVYSLGIVLYEMLTGQPPYRLDGARPSEVEQIICRQEPTRPSTRAGDDPDQVAESKKLVRRLRGDLDNIVLKALRKEPDRRYQSVEEFAEDLGRYRASFPVLARPDTWRYRAMKFVTRHKAGVVVGAGVAASLAASFVAVLSERNTARVERTKAEQVSRFLIESFRVSDPSESRGKTLTAREVLQQGADRVEREMNSQPGMRANILRTMSEVYASIGLNHDAQKLIDRAFAARREAGETKSAEGVEDEIQLGRILLTLGEWQKSAERFKSALAQPDASASRGPERRAAGLYHLGMVYLDLGSWEDARRSLEESLALRRRAGDEALVAETLSGMADLRFRQGDYTGCLEYGKQAYAIRTHTFGTMHPAIADSLNQMAMAYDGLGKSEETLRLAKEALAMRRAIYGESHVAVAMSLNDLAAFYAHVQRLSESRDTHLQALAVYRRVFGEKHPFIATSLDNLGATLYEMGEHDQEEEVKRQAMEMRRELFGEESKEYADSLNSWGVLLAGRTRIVEAEPFLRKCLVLRRKLYPADSRTIAVAAINVATALERQGKYNDAIPLLDEALRIFRKSHGDHHPSVARTLGLLGTCLVATGDPAKGELRYREALASYGSELHQSAWASLYGLGSLLLARGDLAGAEQMLNQARGLAKKYPQQVTLGAGLIDSALGRCLLRKGKREEGRTLLAAGRKALADARVCASCARELALNRRTGL